MLDSDMHVSAKDDVDCWNPQHFIWMACDTLLRSKRMSRALRSGLSGTGGQWICSAARPQNMDRALA